MMCFPLDLLRVTDLAPRCGEEDMWQRGTPAALQNWVQEGAAVQGLVAAKCAPASVQLLEGQQGQTSRSQG